MNMDIDSEDDLMERILRDLRNVLENDPLIDEFDILPVHESMQNKSPVIHVMNKLALENWCVKPLYVYVYNKFFVWRNKRLKIDIETVLMWTCAILLINPEIETVWNARKELICKSLTTLGSRPKLIDEFKFSELVLSRKPKSSPAFAHRKWIFWKLKEESINPETIKQEFSLCLRMANLYANNYYAWSHRSWIMQEVLHKCLKSVKEELSRTELWVSTHVSDHSGFHYRQFLLSCYRTATPKAIQTTSCALHRLDAKSDPCYSVADSKSAAHQWIEPIHKELIFLTNLQNTYPGHETLWYHRRYLLQEIKLIETGADASFTGSSSFKLLSSDNALQNKRLKAECDLWSVAKEENFLNHCCSVSVRNDWERTLITRHVKWSSNVLKRPLSVRWS